jgi:hypothetical protein
LTGAIFFQGLIEDIPLFSAEEKVALLDAGGEGLAGSFAGQPYACTQVLQRFQFAIAEAAGTSQFDCWKVEELEQMSSETLRPSRNLT